MIGIVLCVQIISSVLVDISGIAYYTLQITINLDISDNGKLVRVSTGTSWLGHASAQFYLSVSTALV